MKQEIAKNIFWVGAIDWNVRKFHGYHYNTINGTTYNSYLVLGEDMNALVDTVHLDFFNEFKTNLEEIIPLEKINYLVVNHAEPDHSGAMEKLLSQLKNAIIVCTAKCKDILDRYYKIKNEYHIVKTNNEIILGGKTLKFIEASMLHWPDSMFTYVKEDNVLLPNDAFGQHIASSKRYADEVDEYFLFNEAKKYYANILTPFSMLITSKIEEIINMGIKPKIIAPSHGLIWRQESDINKIITKYLDWAKGVTNKKVIIVYDSMWGRTEKIVKKIAQGLAAKNVEYKIYRAPVSDKTEIMGEILEAKGIILAAPTLNRGIISTLSEIPEELIGLRFKNKIGFAAGSHGWSGGAVKAFEQKMREAGIEVLFPGLEFKYEPTEEEYTKCYEAGIKFAEKILE